MKRALLAVALAAGPLAAAAPDGPQGPPGTPVTIYVAVERPAPIPATPAKLGPPSEITTYLVAPWRLETGLKGGDFEVLSDSTPVNIAACVPAPRPVSIVLVVDVSASVSSAARSAWLRDSIDGPFVRAVGRGDRMAIGRVGGAGLLFSPGFSDDVRGFVAAARNILKPTEKDWARPFGVDGSPIWDAVDRAVDLLESTPDHRAVILLSDGRATANVHDFSDVTRRAVAGGISISAVSSAQDETIGQTATTAARVRSSVFLERLASDTGGAYIEAFGPPGNPWLRSDKALDGWLRCTLARVVDETHGGYALTFASPVDDGVMHALHVRVKREGLKVRAPLGYRAAQSRPPEAPAGRSSR